MPDDPAITGSAFEGMVAPLTPAAAARRTIEGFTLVACRMAHERVRGENGARVPLCPAATRAARLACGHTNARNEALRALSALEAAGALRSDDVQAIGGELTRIGDAIHALDHRKGDAEKQLALAREAAAASGNSGQAVALAERDVSALEAQHTAHVAELRIWKEQVLSRLAGAP